MKLVIKQQLYLKNHLTIKKNNNDDVKLTTHKKRYISPEERQQIINEL